MKTENITEVPEEIQKLIPIDGLEFVGYSKSGISHLVEYRYKDINMIIGSSFREIECTLTWKGKSIIQLYAGPWLSLGNFALSSAGYEYLDELIADLEQLKEFRDIFNQNYKKLSELSNKLVETSEL